MLNDKQITIIENSETFYKKPNPFIRLDNVFSDRGNSLTEVFLKSITEVTRKEKKLFYTFLVTDLLKQLNLPADGHYQLKNLTLEMAERVNIKGNNSSDEYQGSLFTFNYYSIDNNAYVDVNIPPGASKFFFDLKRKKEEIENKPPIKKQELNIDSQEIEEVIGLYSYTNINKKISDSFRSNNKIKELKLYQIVKAEEFKKTPVIRFNIDDVRRIIGMIDKYPRAFDFKKHFLNKAEIIISEISELWLRFELQKEGRSYKYIDVTYIGEGLFLDYIESGFTEKKIINKWFEKKNQEYLKLALFYSRHLFSKNNDENKKLSDFIYQLIENDKIKLVELKTKLKAIKENKNEASEYENFLTTETFKKFEEWGIPTQDQTFKNAFNELGYDYFIQLSTWVEYNDKSGQIKSTPRQFLFNELKKKPTITAMKTPNQKASEKAKADENKNNQLELKSELKKEKSASLKQEASLYLENLSESELHALLDEFLKSDTGKSWVSYGYEYNKYIAMLRAYIIENNLIQKEEA